MSFKLKNLFSDNNFNLVVGLVSILVGLWAIFYAIPGLFVNLFDTLLGNIILLGIVLISYMYDKYIGIGLTIIFIMIFQFAHMSYIK
jgi:hypothetical protein